MIGEELGVGFAARHSAEGAGPGARVTITQHSDDFIYIKSYWDFKS